MGGCGGGGSEVSGRQSELASREVRKTPSSMENLRILQWRIWLLEKAGEDNVILGEDRMS